MRRVANLAWLNVLQIVHNRGELLSILFLPVLLTFVFGMALGGGGGEGPTKVVFVDRDGSDYSRSVGDMLRSEESLSVEETSYARAREAVDGPFGAAVVVPEGFGAGIEAGREVELEVMKDPNWSGALAVSQIVDGIAVRLSANAFAAEAAGKELDAVREEFLANPLPTPPAASATTAPLHPRAAEESRAAQADLLRQAPPVPVKDLPPEVLAGLSKTFPYIAHRPGFGTLFERADSEWSPPPVGVKTEVVRASKVRGDSTQAEGFSQFSLGFTVMFILFVAAGSAGGIIEEREIGTLARLMMTPASKGQLVLGKIFGISFTASLEAAIMIGLGAFVFDVPWGHDPVPLLMVVGSYILAATGLSVLMTAIVRTRSQLAAVSNVAVVALAMLGGCYWPIDLVSPLMRGIASATPTGWAMAGLTDVVVRSQGLSAAVTPTLVLLGFAAVFMGLGLRLLKFE